MNATGFPGAAERLLIDEYALFRYATCFIIYNSTVTMSAMFRGFTVEEYYFDTTEPREKKKFSEMNTIAEVSASFNGQSQD